MFNNFYNHSPGPDLRARAEPVLAGIMHKCFQQVVDPVRFREDRDYTIQMIQTEQAEYAVL